MTSLERDTRLPADSRQTHMAREAGEASEVIARQFLANAATVRELGQRLRSQPPRAVVTVARGSSDHAATYAKYLIETRLGIPVTSLGPSVSSVYGASPVLAHSVLLAISQSGRSPDLLDTVARARSAGAFVVAICNHAEAPLMGLADVRLPLHAGAELSVAATKTWIASIGALLQLCSAWSGSTELQAALSQLPTLLQQARELDWRVALGVLQPVQHLYVIGRGLGLAVAQETALKCKETCALHAEAFSSAEVRHGPFALLGPHFPALLVTQNDATRAGVEQLAFELAGRGVPVILAGAPEPPPPTAHLLSLPALPCPAVCAPVVLAASLYPLLAELALARGLDPDHPPYLRKVTETH